MPSAFISGLSGIQSMPPDMPVEPPTTPCFSTITGFASRMGGKRGRQPAAAAAHDHDVEGLFLAGDQRPPPLENSVCSAMRCPPRLPICVLADHILGGHRRLRRLRARSAGHLSRCAPLTST